MKYSLATIFKALLAGVTALVGAATAAANGPDLSLLDLGQWLLAIGAGATATGALLHKPTAPESTNGKAVSTVQDVVTAVTEAHQSLTQEAVDSIKKVQDAVGEVVGSAIGSVPVLGPLATQVINSLPRL